MNPILDEIRYGFTNSRKMAERALAQVDDAGFFASPGPETNSLAIIVKHMAGNLRSRWRDFLTTDGEKPDRYRDTEFELADADTREALMERWAAGWDLVADQLTPLTDADLDRTVMIRWEPHSVLAALQRQLTHAAYHVGQITMLARHYAQDWESLSIPVGGSDAFNDKMRRRAESGGA
jgi:uncharacterized damage-inducible protein DinB